jgi:anthranilate phosphoribosyltransferase
VSSKSGSADVLEALGANIMLKPDAGRAVDRRDRHRLHVRAVASQRDEARGAGAQGARRAYDLQLSSGPLTNPAGAPNQLLGVFPPRPRWHPGARAAALGSKHVLGRSTARTGMDEVSRAPATMVGELKDGEGARIRESTRRISGCR